MRGAQWLRRWRPERLSGGQLLVGAKTGRLVERLRATAATVKALSDNSDLSHTQQTGVQVYPVTELEFSIQENKGMKMFKLQQHSPDLQSFFLTQPKICNKTQS